MATSVFYDLVCIDKGRSCNCDNAHESDRRCPLSLSATENNNSRPNNRNEDNGTTDDDIDDEPQPPKDSKTDHASWTRDRILGGEIKTAFSSGDVRPARKHYDDKGSDMTATDATSSG